MKLLLVCLVCAVIFKEIRCVPTDFRAIFQTPRKDYDKLEILERSSFDSDSSKSDVNQDKNHKDQSSYANAQILVRFGDDDEDVKNTKTPQCNCGQCCQCGGKNPCVCFNPCPSCCQKLCPHCTSGCAHCAKTGELGAAESNTLKKDKSTEVKKFTEINEEHEEVVEITKQKVEKKSSEKNAPKEKKTNSNRDTRGAKHVQKAKTTTERVIPVVETSEEKQNKKITNDDIEKDLAKLTNSQEQQKQSSDVSHLKFVTVGVDHSKLHELNEQDLQSALVPYNYNQGSKMIVSYPIFNRPSEVHKLPQHALDMLIPSQASNDHRHAYWDYSNGNAQGAHLGHYGSYYPDPMKTVVVNGPRSMDGMSYVLMPQDHLYQ